jgi:hypothetical protein
MGINVDHNENKRQIIDFIKKNQRVPKEQDQDLNETELAIAMKFYRDSKTLLFDESFTNKITNMRLKQARDLNRQKRKKYLIDFINKNNRLPSKYILDEVALHRQLNTYTKISNPCFDVEILDLAVMTDRCFKSGIEFSYRKKINKAFVQTKQYLDRSENEK